MRVTVWTKFRIDNTNPLNSKSKCVFIGDVSIIPCVGSHVTFNDGCMEKVIEVVHDLDNDEVEIKIDTFDENNDYGECLFRKNEK